MRISDWSSDVCSSDLRVERVGGACAPLDQGSLQNGAELEALAGVEQRVGRVVRYLEFLSVQCDPSLLHEAEAQRHHLLRRARIDRLPKLVDLLLHLPRDRKSTRLNSSH